MLSNLFQVKYYTAIMLLLPICISASLPTALRSLHTALDKLHTASLPFSWEAFAKNIGYQIALIGDYSYFRPINKKFKGEREDVSVKRLKKMENPSKEPIEKKKEKEINDLKEKLSQQYKIHLMPKNEHIVELMKKLLQEILNSPELLTLINNIKLYEYLELTQKQYEEAKKKMIRLTPPHYPALLFIPRKAKRTRKNYLIKFIIFSQKVNFLV